MGENKKIGEVNRIPFKGSDRHEVSSH